MNDHDSRTLKSPQTTDAPSTIDDRDVRALTNPMTVLDDVDPVSDELPAVAGERGVYLVVSHSGAEHVVDATEPRCTCSDFEYRDVRCKHLRRVAFATGERTLPDWANDDAVDDALGQHVRRVATDGGSIDDDSDDENDDVEYPTRRGDSLDVSIEDAPSPFPDEREVDVEVENAHLSLVADGVLQPAREASSSQRGKAYLPLDALHAAVRRALDRHDLALVEYRHATIDVPIENILDDEYDVNPNIVTVTFTLAVERPPDAVAETDGGTVATDAGASTPTSSTSETATIASDDVESELPDGVDGADVAVADTGAGLLVYVVEREYRSHIDRETEVARELIGFADVEDWDAIDEAVRARGHGHGDVLHLPEFDVDELPDPVDGNGGDDR
ncbi:hypothetical protein DJ71_13080 [Halorubrum sp. E3]|nr:hypothetical protein DJ71_13080 [Halorubrum sp. E3]